MSAIPFLSRQPKFRNYFRLASHNPPHLDVNSNAGQVFDEMPKRNVESATALIGRLAKQNQHRSAIDCFLRMLDIEIKPNEYTFGTVLHSSVVLEDLHLGRQLHSYTQKLGLSSNVFVGSAMMNLYAKLSITEDVVKTFDDIDEPNVVSYATLISRYIKEGMFEKAGLVFRSMPERNVVSWNTMISGFSQRGKNEESVNFFIEMLREGVIPTQFSYPCVVIAAANIGALGIGRSIHACAVKFLGNLSLFLANSLISFYAKCGSMEESLLVFKKMRERNVVSWNAVICGYAQNGQGNEAIAMYNELKLTTTGIKPNSVTFLGLLLACDHAGLVDEAFGYFKEARCNDFGILRAEHYACMTDLLSRSGRFREAESFMRDLPFDPGLGFWKSLLGGCWVHSNFEVGKVVAKKILEFKPGDASSYVMLSNAHCAAGRWDDVLRVREKMREKGMRRIPGSSWVEVKSKVHVFVRGDKRHCNGDEIYMVLGILIQHLTDRQEIDAMELSRLIQCDL